MIKQHYTVSSPWGGMRLGCLWDEPGKEGSAVIDERDVILKSSFPEDCSHCNSKESVTLMAIVDHGLERGKSAYEALNEAGFIRKTNEVL